MKEKKIFEIFFFFQFLINLLILDEINPYKKYIFIFSFIKNYQEVIIK
jgi:hypothetical protein